MLGSPSAAPGAGASPSQPSPAKPVAMVLQQCLPAPAAAAIQARSRRCCSPTPVMQLSQTGLPRSISGCRTLLQSVCRYCRKAFNSRVPPKAMCQPELNDVQSTKLGRGCWIPSALWPGGAELSLVGDLKGPMKCGRFSKGEYVLARHVLGHFGVGSAVGCFPEDQHHQPGLSKEGVLEEGAFPKSVLFLPSQDVWAPFPDVQRGTIAQWLPIHVFHFPWGGGKGMLCLPFLPREMS